METKWWYKLIRWFAGFFEDQKGSGSSKRIYLYITIIFLKLLINQAPIITEHSYQAYQMALWVVGAITLFLLGAITSEFFAKNTIPIISKTASSSTETKTETTETK